MIRERTVHLFSSDYPARREGPEPSDLKAYLSLAQALYYLATGLWPLINVGTFQKVTGPKTDLWLAKTVGLLVTAIGGVLGIAGLRRHFPPEVPLLATGSAAGLTGIDVIYVLRRRIPPIYLVDALAQLALIAGWVFLAMRGVLDSRP